MGNPAFDPSPQCINLVGVAYLCSTREVKASRLQQGHPQIRREVSDFKGSLGRMKIWKEREGRTGEPGTMTRTSIPSMQNSGRKGRNPARLYSKRWEGAYLRVP